MELLRNHHGELFQTLYCLESHLTGNDSIWERIEILKASFHQTVTKWNVEKLFSYYMARSNWLFFSIYLNMKSPIYQKSLFFAHHFCLWIWTHENNTNGTENSNQILSKNEHIPREICFDLMRMVYCESFRSFGCFYLTISMSFISMIYILSRIRSSYFSTRSNEEIWNFPNQLFWWRSISLWKVSKSVFLCFWGRAYAIMRTNNVQS